MSEIENVLHENRHFPPPREFAQKSRLSKEPDFQRMYRDSIESPDRFWGRIAGELPWMEPYSKVLDWSGAPVAKWFVLAARAMRPSSSACWASVMPLARAAAVCECTQ